MVLYHLVVFLVSFCETDCTRRCQSHIARTPYNYCRVTAIIARIIFYSTSSNAYCNEKVACFQVSPTTSAETTSQGAHQANWEAPIALVLLALSNEQDTGRLVAVSLWHVFTTIVRDQDKWTVRYPGCQRLFTCTVSAKSLKWPARKAGFFSRLRPIARRRVSLRITPSIYTTLNRHAWD